MALYLPDSDGLFIHIPKCGGHFVEEVLKTYGIRYEHAKPVANVCPRHGRASDHKAAKHTFCTTRKVDSWMRSYWRFHMIQGHNRKHWDAGVHFPHRRLGPPMATWQDFQNIRSECEEYLREMEHLCSPVIPLENINNGLSKQLREMGYNVSPEQIAAVPRANPTILKVELGGGTRAFGNGFANIDVDPAADFQWNLDETPYPFPDDSVNEVYSSHCLEHLECPHRTLKEIARICCVGSRVEIRVPHPASHMAMCAGHKHVFSPLMVENIDKHFPELHWTGEKRLKLTGMHYNPTTWLPDAKRELPFLNGLSDQTIMKWIPNTAHETVFVFEVRKNV